MNDISFLNIAQLGVVSALVTIAVGWIKEHLTHSREITRTATYAANRVAPILERFAHDCADSITDNDMHKDSGGYAGRAHGALPAFPVFPTDIDWRSLNKEMVARVLMFPNEVTSSDRAIAFWEDVDRESISGECDEQAGKCGYRAWKLATDLRAAYELPAPEVTWDHVALLKKFHDSALVRRKPIKIVAAN